MLTQSDQALKNSMQHSALCLRVLGDPNPPAELAWEVADRLNRYAMRHRRRQLEYRDRKRRKVEGCEEDSSTQGTEEVSTE